LQIAISSDSDAFEVNNLQNCSTLKISSDSGAFEVNNLQNCSTLKKVLRLNTLFKQIVQFEHFQYMLYLFSLPREKIIIH